MKATSSYRCIILVTAGLAFGPLVTAQSVRLDKLKEQFGQGKPIRVGGGLAANAIGYTGNGGYGRNPFSYFVNGNVTFHIYGLVSLPFSFTLSNLSGNYTYPIPPNRLSVHPSYKWITGHAGTFAMTFSPYTLNGYLFTGGGADLEPQGPVKASVVYGRLQKAVAYDSANSTVPAAYERWGYAAKVQFENEKYRAGVIVFRAWDEVGSLQHKPDSLGIYPMENTVVSVNGGIRVLKQMDLTVEYAVSALTRDVRAEDAGGSGILRHAVDSKASTGFYNALKTQLQYTVETTVVGVAYERIDPGYQTLGAYYSNNDLENITVNAAQPLFNGKVQVAMNAGYQRDNLDRSKSGSSSRAIASVNLSCTPNDKLTTALSYSNFQSYMRMRPQFQTINQLDNFQHLDTLDYTQVSQNANASVSYTITQTDERMRSVGVDLSFQETADKQGGVIRNGNGSRFYNTSISYHSQPRKGFNVTGAFNITYNTIGRADFVTLGPTAGINSKVVKKKVSIGTSVSYNASRESGTWSTQVISTRANAVYNLKKRHNFTLMILNQSRKTPTRSFQDLTVTMGYNFTFS